MGCTRCHSRQRGVPLAHFPPQGSALQQPTQRAAMVIATCCTALRSALRFSTPPYPSFCEAKQTDRHSTCHSPHGKHHLITSRADWEQYHETPLCPGRQKATITRAMGGACSPAELTSGTHAKNTQKAPEIIRETRRYRLESTQKSLEKLAEITRKDR